jgi:hypothetical protein
MVLKVCLTSFMSGRISDLLSSELLSEVVDLVPEVPVAEAVGVVFSSAVVVAALGTFCMVLKVCLTQPSWVTSPTLSSNIGVVNEIAGLLDEVRSQKVIGIADQDAELVVDRALMTANLISCQT